MDSKRAVFLDRDGVVNKEKNCVRSWAEFEFVPGIVEGVRRLNEAGFLVVIVTNQSGISRGLYTHEDVREIHEKMQKTLKENGAHIDDIFYCPHYIEDNCDCRKPKPRMILEAARKHNIDLKESWVIGDSERDIEAGRRAGCNTILLQGQEKEQIKLRSKLPDHIAADLLEAAKWIVEQDRNDISRADY